MPQLDIFAFSSVVSWLLIIIGIFYNIILVSGLSKIYKILLYRKKKLEYYNFIKEELDKEIFFLLKINTRIISNLSKVYKSSPQVGNIVIEKSLAVEKEFLNKEFNLYKNWLESNKIGVESVGKEGLVNLVKQENNNK